MKYPSLLGEENTTQLLELMGLTHETYEVARFLRSQSGDCSENMYPEIEF